MHSAGKASKAFYSILKIFGLACYSVIDDKRRIVKTTFLDKVIFVATVFLWTALTYCQIRGKIILDAAPEGKESIIHSLWLNLYIVQNIFLLVVVITSFMQRTKIENIFKNLWDFDQKALRVSWKTISQKKLFRRALLLLGFYVFLTIAYAILSIFSMWSEIQIIELNHLFNVVNDCLVMLVYTALSEQFIVAVSSVRNKLSTMNINFRCFFKISRHPLLEISVINNAIEMFDNLADAVDDINDVFAKQMNAVIFSAVLLEMIGSQMLLMIFLFNEPMAVGLGIDLATWFVSLIALKFMVIYASSSCSGEARKLNILVDKLSNSCSSDGAYKKLSALSSKMQLRRIAFNTGLFNIAWTIILPIFSTITTYMVIMAQFMNPPKT